MLKQKDVELFEWKTKLREAERSRQEVRRVHMAYSELKDDEH